MTWREFRDLTAGIPDDEEVVFECLSGFGYQDLTVDEEETIANFFNDNTVILKDL